MQLVHCDIGQYSLLHDLARSPITVIFVSIIHLMGKVSLSIDCQIINIKARNVTVTAQVHPLSGYMYAHGSKILAYCSCSVLYLFFIAMLVDYLSFTLKLYGKCNSKLKQEKYRIFSSESGFKIKN